MDADAHRIVIEHKVYYGERPRLDRYSCTCGAVGPWCNAAMAYRFADKHLQQS